MSVLPDPLTDVIGLFLKRAMDAKIFRYAVLVLEMAIAGAIAGFAASGIALISGQDVAWSKKCLKCTAYSKCFDWNIPYSQQRSEILA